MRNEDLQKAAALLREQFGENWLQIVQTLGTDDLRRRAGKDLTSFIAYPERGEGGNNKWRGNCSPEVVKAILKYSLETKKFYRKDTTNFVLLDPMSGSGTSKAAADQFGVQSVLYDLNPKAPAGRGNWNALRDDVEDSADLIFFHPPYHSIVRYSGAVWGDKAHPDDLSQCENYQDFLEKLNYVIRKLFLALRKDGRLAILVGDIRSKGKFYSMQHDLMKMGNFDSFVVKAQFNCVSDSRTYAKPFIPIVTEYLLVFQKNDVMMVPYSRRINKTVDIMELDHPALTWNHLIRMVMENVGGRASLSELYAHLENHPKSKKNPHFRDRIRATLHEHPNQFQSCGTGCYQLSYQVA